MRGEKPFKLIIWSTFKNLENDLENVSIYSNLHPFDDFADWFKPECQTMASKEWEKSLCNFVKTEIEKEKFELKTFKTSIQDKLKEKIKPILKNIFTITNDVELNAKILVILGIKIKLKELKGK